MQTNNLVHRYDKTPIEEVTAIYTEGVKLFLDVTQTLHGQRCYLRFIPSLISCNETDEGRAEWDTIMKAIETFKRLHGTVKHYRWQPKRRIQSIPIEQLI